MAGGWGNYIMQDQPSFVVLDSFMMLINVFLLACFPPGIFLPTIVKGGKAVPMGDGTKTARAGEDSQDPDQGGLKAEEETKESHP